MWHLLSVTVQEEEKSFTRCVVSQEEYTVKGRKRIFLKKQTYCCIIVNNNFFLSSTSASKGDCPIYSVVNAVLNTEFGLLLVQLFNMVSFLYKISQPPSRLSVGSVF
jgi:hypothetical protein